MAKASSYTTSYKFYMNETWNIFWYIIYAKATVDIRTYLNLSDLYSTSPSSKITSKGFFSIVNWPWRFCPPALLSSNWMGNNFREQQPNEDKFLPEKKWNFLIISKHFHFMLDKGVCLFFVPFYPPFAEEVVRPFFSQEKTLFFVSNVYWP